MSLDVSLSVFIRTNVFDYNITHNLGKMAAEAGLYKALWRPEEVGIKKAGQLIKLLEEGLAKLNADPDFFKKFEPDNGWGNYANLVTFVKNYLEKCKEYPEADIYISR